MDTFITKERVGYTVWALGRKQDYINLKLDQCYTMFDDSIGSLGIDSEQRYKSEILDAVRAEIQTMEQGVRTTTHRIENFVDLCERQLDRNDSNSNLKKIRSSREVAILHAEVRQRRKMCRSLKRLILAVRRLIVARGLEATSEDFQSGFSEHRDTMGHYEEKIKCLWEQT